MSAGLESRSCGITINQIYFDRIRMMGLYVKQGIEAEGFRTGFLQSLRFMVYHL